MLGFLKKSKKEKTDKASEKASPDKNGQPPEAEGQDAKPEKKPKKKFSIKKLIFILLMLAAIVGAGFTVYLLYFSGGGSDDQPPPYKHVMLNHVKLPKEILEFSFHHLPDLYTALVAYNNEIIVLDAEIARIQAIGTQYPDQKNIADKETKVWEKTRTGLEKSFLKIEKTVKETYVLFRVNQEQGLAVVKETALELAKTANDALTPVQEMTQKIKTVDDVPEGLIQGTIYKIKKKFL